MSDINSDVIVEKNVDGLLQKKLERERKKVLRNQEAQVQYKTNN